MFLYNIFISNAIKMYKTISIVFGTVHSKRAVVVLGGKGGALAPDFPLSSILSALLWIICTIQWVGLTLKKISTICSLFSSQLNYIYFSSLLIIFHWFFTWIAISDVDLHFSFMLVKKANSVEKETTWAAWLHRQRN